MKPPMFVRPFLPGEREALEQGLRSSNAFVVRRCQCLLKSAEGLTPRQIQKQLGWTDQTVRNAIRAFAQEGLGCLQEKSSRPQSAAKLLDGEKLEALKDLLHHRPRDFGLPTSFWTLDDVAKVCAEQALTPSKVSRETIRDAVKRLKVGWQRAKRWVESPDPAYARKKGHGIG
jgi:transposase